MFLFSFSFDQKKNKTLLQRTEHSREWTLALKKRTASSSSRYGYSQRKKKTTSILSALLTIGVL